MEGALQGRPGVGKSMTSGPRSPSPLLSTAEHIWSAALVAAELPVQHGWGNTGAQHGAAKSI